MLQQQQTASAYRMAGGNWQRGSVNYQITQQGYKPISYDFSAYRSGGRGSFYQDSRFLALNPIEFSINKLPSIVINPPGTPCPVQSAATIIAMSSKDLFIR